MEQKDPDEPVFDGHPVSTIEWTGELCDVLVTLNRQDVLEWGLAHGHRLSSRSAEKAAGTGNLNLLKWLKTNGASLTDVTFETAVRRGDEAMVDWLYQQGCKMRELACGCAAYGGHFQLLKKLMLEYRCPYGWGVFMHSAERGDLPMLEWVLENCPLPDEELEDLLDVSAYSGSLEMVEYLRKAGYRWSKKFYSNAGTAGHVHLLQYALVNGCPYDEYVSNAAARRGNMVALAFFVENLDKPWNEKSLEKLLQGGSIQALNYYRDTVDFVNPSAPEDYHYITNNKEARAWLDANREWLAGREVNGAAGRRQAAGAPA